MKSYSIIMLLLFCLVSCRGPEYFTEKGAYDKALDLYSSNLRTQTKERQKLQNLKGLEFSFARAQSRDSAELSHLNALSRAENSPRINTLHRQIQDRQRKVAALQPLHTKSGFAPRFSIIETIDALEKDSRLNAARYLYAHAQSLLAITDSTGQRAPAREAYYTLLDLKSNYFPYWENANALIDSAYHVGKAHVIFEPSTAEGVSDGQSFWDYFAMTPNFVKSEWLLFYKDSSTRKTFDYRIKCQLLSIYVSGECTSNVDRYETKQVEDGYDEKIDSTGHVISRTPKYKTETKTITTYSSTRTADSAILFELVDEHTGLVLAKKTIQASHNYSESSELFVPSAPSYWGMIGYVASDVEWDVRTELKKTLVKR